MQASRQSLRFLIAVVTGGALLSVATNTSGAQSRKAAPVKKPATPASTVVPTPSEGSTAAAIRGRPASSAAGRAVNGALRTAVANANVRDAVRAEVLRQLRVRQPLALVNGYWVSVVDLAPAYQGAAVRTALLAALGANGPQLINQARVSADRLVIVFTPATFGQIVMPGFARDITAALGVDALKSHMTDVGPLVVAIVLGLTGAGVTIMAAEMAAMWWEWLSMKYNDYTQATGPNKDYDGDGVANKDDADDDNDGVNDTDDNYPYDPTQTICDCGRPAVSLASSTASGFLSSLVTALNAVQARKAGAISLGAVTPGQPAVLGLLF